MRDGRKFTLGADSMSIWAAGIGEDLRGGGWPGRGRCKRPRSVKKNSGMLRRFPVLIRSNASGSFSSVVCVFIRSSGDRKEDPCRLLKRRISDRHSLPRFARVLA